MSTCCARTPLRHCHKHVFSAHSASSRERGRRTTSVSILLLRRRLKRSTAYSPHLFSAGAQFRMTAPTPMWCLPTEMSFNRALCDDKPAASLSVKEGDTGNCLMFGHAGRDLVEPIVHNLQLEMRDLLPGNLCRRRREHRGKRSLLRRLIGIHLQNGTKDGGGFPPTSLTKGNSVHKLQLIDISTILPTSYRYGGGGS